MNDSISFIHVFFIAILVFSILFCNGVFAQSYTIINGSIVGNGGIEGWDGTTVGGRENGAFQGTVIYQAINSPHDPEAASGSALFTADALTCSLTQQLGFNAEGQTLTVSADIAWDGDWDYIYFGFYEENAWDRIAGASIDITLEVPADTDGTLDDFHTVSATGPLSSTGNPVRVFFGSSCSPYSGGALTPGTSQFAIDNVIPTAPPEPPPPVMTAAQSWELYE